MSKSILEVQSEIQSALEALPSFVAELPQVLRPLVKLSPPKGARAAVSLCYAKSNRQVKRNAPADNWSPGSGCVHVYYNMSLPEEAAPERAKAVREVAPEIAAEPARSEDPVRDLVLALAKAEQDPQLNFVSLTWFRDTYLPQESYAWAEKAENRKSALVEAINRQWILTSRVPNPKNPHYPVTSIRVNRPLADVRRILGQEEGFGSPFAPVAIPGERLSETVLRERR